MLPENDLESALLVAERIRKVLAATPLPTEHTLVYLSVSIGVVTVTPDITSLDQLMIRADLALYSAKQSGRNQVQDVIKSPCGLIPETSIAG